MTKKVDIEPETPEWLKKQVAKAAHATPIAGNDDLTKAMSGGDLEGPSLDLDTEEKFVGEEGQDGSDSILEAIREKTAKKSPEGVEFSEIADELATMLAVKNRKYGDSYAKMAHVLPLFYPNGVPADGLLDAVFILRIVDKLMRIASDQRDDEEDPLLDLCGYGILRLREIRNSKGKEK
jgi:hypothetical protein